MESTITREAHVRASRPSLTAFGLVGVALACMLSGTAAQADDAPLSGTIITVGGFGVMQPKFEGAKHQELAYRPVFSWRGENDRVWLDMPNDGLDFSLLEGSNWRMGVVGNVRWQRHAEDARPRGFKRVGDLDLSVEAGGFAEYWPMPYLRTRAELRNAFFGAEGLVADLSADFVATPFARWTFTGGPRLSLADQTFVDSYYSISPIQAAQSGLPGYKADAGIRSYGAGVSARYQISDNMIAMGYLEYQRLAGSAAETPLVDDRGSPDQFTVGLGLKYSFRAPW